MGDVWVINASPIITLAKAGYLNLLERQNERAVVPAEVVEEVLAGPAADPARLAIEAGWGERIAPAVVPPNILEWGLGRGESAVLALAARDHATAVLDDAQARRCARVLGVRLVGTLGVVIRAKQEWRIASAAHVLRLLVAAGLRVDNDVILRVLKDIVDEAWSVRP